MANQFHLHQKSPSKCGTQFPLFCDSYDVCYRARCTRSFCSIYPLRIVIRINRWECCSPLLKYFPDFCSHQQCLLSAGVVMCARMSSWSFSLHIYSYIWRTTQKEREKESGTERVAKTRGKSETTQERNTTSSDSFVCLLFQTLYQSAIAHRRLQCSHSDLEFSACRWGENVSRDDGEAKSVRRDCRLFGGLTSLFFDLHHRHHLEEVLSARKDQQKVEYLP